MKLPGPTRHFVLAFVMALVLYAVSYTWIENRRTRQGPWVVTFTVDGAGVPGVVVNQPALRMANVKLVFPRQTVPATNAVLNFAVPQAVPFDVPFGECVFMDTTFQPGTVVFNFFGHEVQLMPRVLTLDRKEVPWKSDAVTALTNGGVLPKPARRLAPPPAGR